VQVPRQISELRSNTGRPVDPWPRTRLLRASRRCVRRGHFQTGRGQLGLRDMSMDSPKIRASSCGAWKPLEFSRPRSRAPLAWRWSSRIGASCASVALACLPPDCVEHVDQRVAGAGQQGVVAILDGLHPLQDLLLGIVVALLAGAVDVGERRAHPVIGNLERALAHVGMWQSAQATPTLPCVPWLQTSNSGCWALSTSARFLRVSSRRSGGRRRIVLVVVRFDLLDLEAFDPR